NAPPPRSAPPRSSASTPSGCSARPPNAPPPAWNCRPRGRGLVVPGGSAPPGPPGPERGPGAPPDVRGPGAAAPEPRTDRTAPPPAGNWRPRGRGLVVPGGSAPPGPPGPEREPGATPDVRGPGPFAPEPRTDRTAPPAPGR